MVCICNTLWVVFICKKNTAIADGSDTNTALHYTSSVGMFLSTPVLDLCINLRRVCLGNWKAYPFFVGSNTVVFNGKCGSARFGRLFSALPEIPG